MYELSMESIVSRISNDVAETELDGNIVLLHVEHGKYYNLNTTSSDLWRWLEQEITVTQLVKQLCDKYDCNVDVAISDVLIFLDEMYKNKLLSVH